VAFGTSIRTRAIACLMLALPLAGCAGTGGLAGTGATSAAPEVAREIVLPGERLFPESITSDAAGTIYVGSNPGTVFRAVPGASVASAWIVPDAANGLATVFGVLADDTRGLLWVCSNPRQGEDGAPAIKTFRLSDGGLVASYPLNVQGPAMCNDMTVAPNGDVYATETIGGRLLRLANGGTVFELWATDPEFASADGIVWGGDGQLYMNAIQRNNLVRANRDGAGRFTHATLLTPSRPMGGPDGLRALGGNRFLQSEGNAGLITLVTITGDRAEIVTLADGVDYASAVTAVGDRAFYPEGKLRFLFGPQAGQDPGPFVVRHVAIPGEE
jgi:sugar lactone lactonase YvrE